MSPSIIIQPPKPRRSRKPLPHKPEPACGPVVRHVHGTRVRQTEAPEAAPAESPPDVFDRLKASLRSKD